MTLHAVTLAADEAVDLTDAPNSQLILAAILGIAAVVLLITLAKFHPFLALMLGTAVMGAVAGVAPLDIVDSFTVGFGATVGSVGLLIALGAMVGKLLADSGGSDTIVETIISRVGPRGLPWAMALIAAMLGLPLFFEVGVVLLVPVVILVALRLDIPIMRVGIPALAGLSILHGLVPPHPGPLVAIDALGADLGLTLLFGLLVAAPTLVICGPLLARLVEQWVPTHATTVAAGMVSDVPAGSRHHQPRRRLRGRAALGRRDRKATTASTPSRRCRGRHPSSGILRRRHQHHAAGDLDACPSDRRADHQRRRERSPQFLVFIGTPAVALLAAVLVAMFALGFGSGMNRSQVEKSTGSALPGIAGILLIVAAGGGFKAMLVDAGVGDVIGDWAEGTGISVLLLGWLVAVGVRLATGSATVATITAAGIVTGAATGLESSELSLLVLAIGCGSLFFSHVNDAGFWLVKEYFGLTIGQTIKSWSVMETAISVVGMAFVMLLSLVVV